MGAVNHDYAFACDLVDEGRRPTQHCRKQLHGYHCTDQGGVNQTGQTDEHCDSVCRCVDVSISPATCVVPDIISAACYVATDGTVFDGRKIFLGHLDQSAFMSDGIFDLTALAPSAASQRKVVPSSDEAANLVPAILERDSDSDLHDWALVCENKKETKKCAKSPLKYRCDSKGKVTFKDPELFCSVACECVNLKPNKPCIIQAWMTTCITKDDIVYDDAGKTIAPESEAVILPNGTMDFSNTRKREVTAAHGLANKVPYFTRATSNRDSTAAANTYALVCSNSKPWTTICQKSTYGYYCNSNGALRNTGQEVSFCEATCECIDLYPKPKCIISPFLGVNCLLKDNVAYDDDGKRLGHISDAYVHANGMLDFSQVAGEQDVSPLPSRLFQMHCEAENGQRDGSLTQYCSEHGYSCAADPDNVLSSLHHGSQALEQCSSNCHCPRPFPDGAKMTIEERSVSLAHSKTEDDMMQSHIIAPASGVDSSQDSDTYQLNCGNRKDGLDFCSSSTLFGLLLPGECYSGKIIH